jgi:hypothetical protein
MQKSRFAEHPKLLVRKEGLEPSWVSPPDPKSGASANSATFASLVPDHYQSTCNRVPMAVPAVGDKGGGIQRAGASSGDNWYTRAYRIVVLELPRAMRHSLQSHIIYLENTIQDARNQLTRPDLSLDELQDLEMQLALAESAVSYYRQAYALELNVAGAEPPNDSASSNKNGGNDRPGNSNGEKKKGGALAGRTLRRRTPIPVGIWTQNTAMSRFAKLP